MVLCFASANPRRALSIASSSVIAAGGVGVIIAKNPDDLLAPCRDDFPCIEVNFEVGTQILFYIRSTRSHHHQSLSALQSFLMVYYNVVL